MPQGADCVRQEHLQQLAHERLLFRLPADGLQQSEEPLQVQPQHGQVQEVLPQPQAEGEGAGQRHRGGCRTSGR
eukprot:904996-Alexandrium_andersonii.AAC.1